MRFIVNEITLGQFLEFRPHHDHAQNSPRDQPVRNVSWFDAAAYCQWMNEQEGIPQSESYYFPNAQGRFELGVRIAPDFLLRKGYRLLTQREWLQAAGVSSGDPFFFCDDTELLDSFGWSAKLARSNPASVGKFYPNSFGLFDVHGNVAEWCHDSALDAESDVDLRLTMGGSFEQLPWQLQSDYGRSSAAPGHRDTRNSIRIARMIVGSTPDVFAEFEKAGRRGDWQAVEREFAIALKERPNELAYRLILARLRLYIGDEESFEEICRSLCDQFNDPQRRVSLTPRLSDSRIAYTIAAMWLLRPMNSSSLDAIEMLSEKAHNYGNSGMRNLATVDYRRGNFQQAAQSLAEVAVNDRSFGLVGNLYFQAMAHQKLDHPDEAQQLFAEAQTLFAALTGDVSESDYGIRWRSWIYCMVLQREAREVLRIAQP